MVRESARPLAIAATIVTVVLGASIAIARRIPDGPIVTPLVVFASATVLAMTALGVASRAIPPRTARIAMLALSAAVLVFFAFVRARSNWLGVPIDLAIFGLAACGGGWIGVRVQDPGHMLPAAVVAAAGDLVSVFHPEGPSNAIAASDRALSLLAFSFPAPGDGTMAPAIGLGDLAFVAILLGVAVAHGIATRRVVLLAILGALVAGGASALTGAAFPALPSIGAAVVLGVPRFRILRRRDRTVAIASMVFAIAAAIALIASARM